MIIFEIVSSIGYEAFISLHIIINMADITQTTLQFLQKSKLELESTFQIVFQGQKGQFLQLTIPPNCSNYIQGNIGYSNCYDDNLLLLILNGQKLSLQFKRFKSHFYTNKNSQSQILAISHIKNLGSILIIDLAVYRQSFYINAFDIIASKYKISNQNKKHPVLSNMCQVEFKNNRESLTQLFLNGQKIALQGASQILEKYLAAGEQFYIFSGSVVAMSENIKAQKVNRRCLKLSGPGWIFFEENSRDNSWPWAVIIPFILIVLLYVLAFTDL